MAKKGSKFDGKSLLKEWMDSREWTDELEVDEAASMTRLASSIDINEQHCKLFIETHDDWQCIDLFLYPAVKVKDSKRGEMLALLNEISFRISQGRFTLIQDGTIQYRHRVDFEGAVPSGQSIEVMVQPAWDWCEKYAEVMAAVALTKQSAEDALAELDKQIEAAQESVPDSL